MRRLHRAADQTPEERDRYIDFVRALAIAAVVLGHWLVIAVTEAGGRIDGINALAELAWARPLTWLFQVMPLFFVIGGYANAASLESHRRSNGDSLAWILGRYERLLRPTTAFLAALVLAIAAGRLLGVDREIASTAAWAATLPLWFLLVYLAVVAMAPLTLSAHRRWGGAVPVVLVALVAAGDAARLWLDLPWVADVNYLAAWGAIHQVGFALRDGTLPARPLSGILVAAFGAVALLALTLVGPYPVSMVGVPGERLQNTAPPTLALVALATTQVGVVLALRERATAWLERPRPWLAVVAVNSVILTMFLWHMSAAIVAALVLYGRGIMPVVAVGSVEWLVLRIPWVAACALVLVALIAVFARVELATPGAVKGRRVEGGAASLTAGLGLLSTIGGMFGIALSGPRDHGFLGLPSEAVLAYLIGATLVAAALRRSARSKHSSPPR